MTDKVLRAAIVGTGGIAAKHADSLHNLSDDVELVAATDLDADRLAKFCADKGIPRSYPSLTQLLEREEIDLVQLCTPPGVHADQALECLRAGASVICEKPPTLTLAEFDRIAEVERETGRHFVSIFQHRYGTAAASVKKLIEQQALGRPLVSVCNTLWYRSAKYYEVEWRGKWETEGGGPTLGHGIHQIDLYGHLLGDWRDISARAVTLEREISVEDVSLATIGFENGSVGTIINSVLSPREVSYLRFDFTDGTLEVEHLYGHAVPNWRFTPAPHATDREIWPPSEPDVPSHHGVQIAEVVADLRNGRRPGVTGPALRRTMEIVTGIYASAFTGRTVTRAELGPDNPFYHSLNGKPTA